MSSLDDSIGSAATNETGLSLWRRVGETRLYDLLVRCVIVAWSLFLATAYIQGIGRILDRVGDASIGFGTAAQLLSKTCLFLFFITIAFVTMVRARPVKKSDGMLPRLSAMLGTYLLYGLAFLPAQEQLATGWHLLSSLLLIVGNTLSLAILLRLGRSFSVMPEARRLVTSGPYRIIRHPLYGAELIAMIGAFIQFASLPAATLLAAQIFFQVQRMRNEEKVLESAFPDYAAYKVTTSRLIPGVW
jgi:protein-S-isoprenylcysteine O-methyltransferase Ste14